MNKKEDYDSYEIEEPSDEDRAGSSSEDELDVLLHGTPDQKRKLLREYLTGESESSSEDEFEKEMEAELSTTMKSMECKWTAQTSSGGASGATGSTGNVAGEQQLLYDAMYFDSDSDDDEMPGNSGERRTKQRRILTDSELLYDPDKDDRDQAWVDAQRKGYRQSWKRQPGKVNRKRKSDVLPSSDAVLNCPACMTTLCLDCQRHEKYRTQYRAMFVMNCKVNKEEVLRYKTLNDIRSLNRRKKKKKKMMMKGQQEMEPGTMVTEAPESGVAGASTEEMYHPVQCTECSTEVAVFDKDEVYHFFNILASHC